MNYRTYRSWASVEYCTASQWHVSLGASGHERYRWNSLRGLGTSSRRGGNSPVPLSFFPREKVT